MKKDVLVPELMLERETVRRLDDADLAVAAGGLKAGVPAFTTLPCISLTVSVIASILTTTEDETDDGTLPDPKPIPQTDTVGDGACCSPMPV